MARGKRRRVSAAPAALRWLAADARDVARIDRFAPGVTVPVTTVASGLARWRRRVERRRLLAVVHRGALVGMAMACLLQIGALVSGRDGPGVWLVPSAVVAAALLATGLTRRTSAATAARLLDRDLAFGAGVSTALELESSGRSHGLGVLALADGRLALGGSLVGARARLQPRRGEFATLGTLIAAFAVLLLIPSPHHNGRASAARPGVGATEPNRALHADNGLATDQGGAGATLQGFKQTPLDAPPLAAVRAGETTRAGGANAGHSPYGGGVANDTSAGGNQPTARTLGQTGSVKGSTGNSGSVPGSAGGGKGAHGSGSVSAQADVPAGDRGGTGSAGLSGVSPIRKGPPAAPGGTAPNGPISSTPAGKQGGGIGSSPPGSRPGNKLGKSSPGGGTAGSTQGAKSLGHGVVPQLGGNNGLPLAPGYEAVPGTSGAPGDATTTTGGGAGGAGHSGNASAGAVGRGAAGVPYVPPGGASVASIDRGVVLGYFGSFARVNASGW